MGLRRTVSLFLSLVLLATASTTFAQKLCLQSTVNKATLKVTNKSVVASKCPKGYTALADTSQFRGPQGPAGILNLGSCRPQGQVCNHSAGVNECAVSCGTGEFVLQYSVAYGNAACSVFLSPTGIPTASYSNGIAAGIGYTTGASCSYTVSVNAICCPTA